jgi:hypothetical protein
MSILQMPGADNGVAFVRFYLRSPEGTYWTLRVEKETMAGGKKTKTKRRKEKKKRLALTLSLKKKKKKKKKKKFVATAASRWRDLLFCVAVVF